MEQDPLKGLISMYRARKILRVSEYQLRQAVHEGFIPVRRLRVRGPFGKTDMYAATLEEWRQGWEAYQKANGLWVPPGWVTAGEAARMLGLYPELLWRCVRHGLLTPLVVRRGPRRVDYYAPLEEWERAAKEWRSTPYHQARSRERQKQRAREAGPPPSLVDPETARRRLAEITPERRLCLRVLILATRLGLPWPWEGLKIYEDGSAGRVVDGGGRTGGTGPGGPDC